MAASTRPQYYSNTLKVIDIREGALVRARAELQSAVDRGLVLVSEQSPPIDNHGNIFTGGLGIACLHLYRIYQAITSGKDEQDIQKLVEAAERYTPKEIPAELTFANGRTSPLCHTELGVIFIQMALRLVRGMHPAFRDDKADPKSGPQGTELSDSTSHFNFLWEVNRGSGEAIWHTRMQGKSVESNGHLMGIDEVLCGRAGLLWACVLRNRLYRVLSQGVDFRDADEHVVVDRLMSRDTTDLIGILHLHGLPTHTPSSPEPPEPPPYSWPWIDDWHALGGMHGAAGIMAAMFQADYADFRTPMTVPRSIGQSVPALTSFFEHTMDTLCQTCLDNDGHLPMSKPPFPSKNKNANPLVQICHGTPGLLLMLASARRNKEFRSKHWKPLWNEAFAIGSHRVWAEGLISKGAGICHGIAGNALPWLMWVEIDVDEGWSTAPHLERALAFLKECMNTKPFSEDLEDKYRMPDHPYSLFEGLAGTVLVWMEAVRILDKMLSKAAS
ncbi:LanC-like protein 1 [Cyphellophora attinorum]|uniref:LanC-like protein 1 n=1 Tax=Cyphellophora attinorum TaxID=1664694 RepID=A0A0N1HN43_9EURO|nr:LanC-like protein 1 [Phialophora attinorum]KPI38814.1 LanC-like protein 1 [Phialophora attinorum]